MNERRVYWNRAAGLALLAAAGIYGWWPVFGPDALWAVPTAVAACIVVARAIPARAGAVLLAAWVPASLLLAGLPLGCAASEGARRDRLVAAVTG